LIHANVVPSFRIVVGDNDVTDYVIDNGFFAPNTKEKISNGSFVLDSSVPYNIAKFMSVEFYVQHTTEYKKFGGVVSDVSDREGNFKIRINVKSYAWLTYQNRYTGVFRQDAGTGNRKTIITSILAEKFPSVTWDATSFPDIDAEYDVLYKLYNNQKPGDIFDELVMPIGRDWWIDKDQVFHCKARQYTQVNEPVTAGVHVIGPIMIEVNNNYANIVQVRGARFPKTILQTFSGTGAADEFTLDYFPAGSTSVRYTDDTDIRVTMEGTEGYDDPTQYDAYFKVSSQKLKFNDSTTSGSDNIVVEYNVYDQIYEELAKGSEIDRVGYEVVKYIEDEHIATNDEAYAVAQDYLDNYSTDQYVYTVPVAITTDTQVSNWTIGNAIPLAPSYGESAAYEDIIEENWQFDKSRGLVLTLRFVDFKRTDTDVLRKLLQKIRVEEDRKNASATGVTRYFYFGSNIVVAVQNFAMKTQATGYVFELQENPALWDDRSLMSETGTIPAGGMGAGVAAVMVEDYSAAQTDIFSRNLNDHFVESFMDTWFVHTGSTTASVDTTAKTVTFGTSQTLVLQNVAQEDGAQVRTATVDYTGSISGVTLAVRGAGDWQTVVRAEATTVASPTDKIDVRIVTGTTGTGTLNEVRCKCEVVRS
jgi:hypothetical protein